MTRSIEGPSPEADLAAIPNRASLDHDLPQFAAMLDNLVAADRLIAEALDLLIELITADAAEGADPAGFADVVREQTGVSLQQWLTIVARKTTGDARMLRTAAQVCARVPSLRAGFRQGQLSWAQVRSVALICQRIPRRLDDDVDAAIAPVIDQASGLEPNAVVWAVRQALASVESTTAEPEVAEPREFLAMQPRPDGHGGKLFGEVGADSWARLDAALNAPEDSGTAVDADRHRADAGKRRLDRLVGLLDMASTEDLPDAVSPSSPGMRSRPQLLVRAELATLLSRTQTPGALLTRLLGGKIWTDATTTRRLVDERGADLRTVIIDCGRVVGVGRRTRVPPGWLQDAVLALHDTCAAPGCDAAARAADIDHARPWYPVGGSTGAAPGRTDVDQLAPVCAHHNRRKERDGWRVTQHADHSRTWTHPRTGLSTTTTPATWLPKPSPPAPQTPDVARERRADYQAWSGHDPPEAGPGRNSSARAGLNAMSNPSQIVLDHPYRTNGTMPFKRIPPINRPVHGTSGQVISMPPTNHTPNTIKTIAMMTVIAPTQ